MRGVFLMQPAPGLLPPGRHAPYCFIEPDAPIRPGDIVWLRTRHGVEIGIYQHRSDRGWHVIETRGGMLAAEMNPDAVVELWPATWTGRTPPPISVPPTGTGLAHRLITISLDRIAAEVEAISQAISRSK